MYDRTINGKEHTFVVSGKLWGESLVMLDRETRSEWSHALGKAMDGALKGTHVDVIPSTMTTWKRWREEHPETTVTVLSRTVGGFTPALYQAFANGPERFVLGVRHRGEAVAYPFGVLQQSKLVNDEIGGDPVVIVFDADGAAATAFRRALDGRVLEFELRQGALFADGSRFQLSTGKAVQGPLEGKQLEALTAMRAFRRSWNMFQPDGRIYGE